MFSRQEYDYTKLLALSESGAQYVEDFTFPAGCKCYQNTGWGGYRQTGPLSLVQLHRDCDLIGWNHFVTDVGLLVPLRHISRAK